MPNIQRRHLLENLVEQQSREITSLKKRIYDLSKENEKLRKVNAKEVLILSYKLQSRENY